MKSLIEYYWNDSNLLFQIHEKISSWTAHLIGPVVFNFGAKEEKWNLTTDDLLKFPEGSVGKKLGEFLKKGRLEPIAGAESHDLYHLFFDFSTSFRDEVALQFFLMGNGKKSIASFGTAIGAWIILPFHWRYLKESYRRGKECTDISIIDPKAILKKQFDGVRMSLLKERTNDAIYKSIKIK